jgi:hypothetical protein
MEGFSTYSYLTLLSEWHKGLLRKEKLLARGFRVYTFIFFIQIVSTGTCVTVTMFLNTLMIGLAETTDTQTALIINSVCAGLGVIAVIANAVAFVFKPQATATSALAASRNYGGLAKELLIEITQKKLLFSGMPEDDIAKFSSANLVSRSNPLVEIDSDVEHKLDENEKISFDTYAAKLSYYSVREQLICGQEPGLLLIGYWNTEMVFDKDYIPCILTPQDAQLFHDIVYRMEISDDRRKMEKILTRIMLVNGNLEEVV